MRIPSLLAVAALTAASHSYAQVPQPNSVFIIGRATAAAPPDTCTLRVTTESQAKDRAKTVVDIQKTVDKIASLAQIVGAKGGDIDASDIELSSHVDDKKNRASILQRRIQIVVRRITECAQFVDSVLPLPHVQSVQVSFSVSDEARMKNELLVKASEDARRKAVDVSTALGRKLGRASSISEEPFAEIAAYFSGMGHLTFGENNAASFVPSREKGNGDFRQPEKVYFSKNLFVVFELE